MRIYEYLDEILRTLNAEESNGVPTPSWRIEEYLKDIYDAIRSGIYPSDEQVAEAIDAWLDDHPEATTTVEDGAITNAKLATSFVTPGTASAYSSSATYAVGDYVFHGGALYRCITAITTAEAWTAAHWTEVALGDDVSNLKSAMTQLDTSCKNGTGVLVEQGYFSNDYKSVDTSFGTYKYKYISGENVFIMARDETAGTKVVAISMADSGLTLAQRLVSIADYPVCKVHVDTNIPQTANPVITVFLYQSNGSTLSHNYTIALETGSADYIIDIAKKIKDSGWANDVYYVIAKYSADSATYTSAPYIHATNYGFFTKSQIENYNLAQKYSVLNTRMASAEVVTAKAITDIGEKNLADETKFEFGYLDATGTLMTAGNTNRETTTDYIPVKESELYTIQVWITNSGDFWTRIEYFNSSKVYQSRDDITSGATLIDGYNYKLINKTIASGIAYVRISFRTFGDAKIKVEKGNAVTAWTPGFGSIVNAPAWNGTKNYPIFGIIHRGCGENQTAPENTIPGFIWGKNAGFHFAETDIRYTSDGVAVLLHDASINRTARNSDGTELTSTVNIADITYEQALEYDFGIYKGSTYAGTKIPTLEQLVVLAKNIDLHLILELKAFKDVSTDIPAIIALLKSYGMLNHVSWLSGNYMHLFVVRSIDPSAHLCHLSSAATFNRSMAVLSQLKTPSNEVTLSIITSDITSERIATMKSLGISCNAYCPNTTEAMLAVDEFVTSVTSDVLNYETVRKNSILGE